MPSQTDESQSAADPARSGIRGPRGIRRLARATGYSLSGFASAWRSEEAFRLEALLAAAMVPTALWLGRSPVERILLIGSVALVLIVELLNTAIEYTVDRIGTERHRLSGAAKDLGSAAVLISLLLTLLAWSLIAWDRFTG